MNYFASEKMLFEDMGYANWGLHSGMVVYRDIVTDVLYIAYDAHGGITPIVGADGLPMTYDKYIALMEAKGIHKGE